MFRPLSHPTDSQSALSIDECESKIAGEEERPHVATHDLGSNIFLDINILSVLFFKLMCFQFYCFLSSYETILFYRWIFLNIFLYLQSYILCIRKVSILFTTTLYFKIVIHHPDKFSEHLILMHRTFKSTVEIFLVVSITLCFFQDLYFFDLDVIIKNFVKPEGP